MNAVFVVLAPLVIAVFALTMERFEAIVVGTGPADSAKGRRAEAQKAAAAAAEAQAVAEAQAAEGETASGGAGGAAGGSAGGGGLPGTGKDQQRRGGDGTGHEPGMPGSGTERRK